MPSSHYEEDDEITLEDDETISFCSSVISEEMLDIARSRPVRLSQRRGLFRSDGREAVVGQRQSGFRPIEPGQVLQASPRVQELKRRRPTYNSTSSPSLPTVTLVSEDSPNERVDQVPSCPRREKSRDRDSWQTTSAGLCHPHSKD